MRWVKQRVLNSTSCACGDKPARAAICAICCRKHVIKDKRLITPTGKFNVFNTRNDV